MSNKYDNDYFFVEELDREGLPTLTPDKNTEDRTHGIEAQPMGSPPLVFFNGASDYQKKLNVKVVAKPPEILFNGSNLLVPSRIREALLKLNIPNLDMHPSVYIHDDKKWYEDYWYMTFTETFDCWDRTNSTYYDDDPLEMDEFPMYDVYTYSLNEELLDKIPLEQRLLFKMGGTALGMIVCHKSIKRLFITEGTQLTPIAEY
jgi:hypothetical protein